MERNHIYSTPAIASPLSPSSLVPGSLRLIPRLSLYGPCSRPPIVQRLAAVCWELDPSLRSSYRIKRAQERLQCLQALREAHVEDDHAFPAAYCVELFEKLVAAWGEEFRETRRKICAAIGIDNPRPKDIEIYALLPRCRRIHQLSVPYKLGLERCYQTVVLPMSRLLHKQLHDSWPQSD